MLLPYFMVPSILNMRIKTNKDGQLATLGPITQ